MFVFRPQQTLTHAPSCGSTGSRGPHHVGRQAAKNQRRTQPKPRRPQALQRRRHLLRDLYAAGQVGHRLALISPDSPTIGAAAHSVDPLHYFLDAAPDHTRGGRCKGGARARLCAKLLQRSCAELEAALERKHRGMWPEHVLQGDFHVMEAMRRICESFGLRPELERQVLKATADRAQAILKRRAEARSCDTQRAGHHPVARDTAEGEDEMEPDSDGSTQHAVSSVSDDASAAGTLDGASSDESLMIDGELARPRTASEDAPTSGMTGSSSGGSSSECDAGRDPPWRLCWRSRVLRVLGLQRLWPSQGVVLPEAAATPTQQEESAFVEDSKDSTASAAPPRKSVEREDKGHDEDEEDFALSSKLVAAVRNAELHAATARAGKAAVRCGDDSPAGSTTASSGASTSGGSSSVRFARKSEVSFFECHHDAAAPPPELAPSLLEYRRPLETKVFDGPSGHKAKRTSSVEKKASPHDDRDEEALSNEDDEEDEWEDHCDDIAELMSQERSGLLWSPSW